MAEPVVSGRKLTRTQRERLAQAEALAAGGLSDKRRAVAMVREIERELAEAREMEATEASIARALERARHRGEAFEVEAVEVGEWRRNEDGSLARRHGQLVLDVQTVRRASRIDGLASLYKAGAISDDEKRTADAYRDLYARACPPMSLSAYGSTQAGFRDVGHMLVSVAEAGTALHRVSEIARRIGDARTVAVLEAVAGRGASIRSLGAGGDLNGSNRERLKVGLEAAKGVLAELNAATK